MDEFGGVEGGGGGLNCDPLNSPWEQWRVLVPHLLL